MVFKDLEEKKVFLSSLYKLKAAGEELKRVHVERDLSPQERDHLNIPLKKAQEKNEFENSPDFQYKVRSPPFPSKIVRLPHKEAKNCGKTHIVVELILNLTIVYIVI